MCALRQMSVFRAFEGRELDFVEWFKMGELEVDQGSTVLVEGHNSPHLYTLLEGWAFRYKMLEDGRRQILSFILPGDFVGLQGPVLKEMQHSVEAASRVRLCVFPRERLWKLYEKHPALSHDLVWLATRGERIVDENLLSVGRRSAAERVSFLAVHLFKRCDALGLTQGQSLDLPITQRHFADALGLSLVHTNKTLRRLERNGFLSWKGSKMSFKALGKLKELSGFDESEESRRPII